MKLLPEGLPRFDRVYESYAAKCGGGVSLRAMEDAAKQFVAHSAYWRRFRCVKEIDLVISGFYILYGPTDHKII